MTLTVVGWVDIFIRKRIRDIVIQSLKYCQENKGLVINAFVIMSNHLHLIVHSKEDATGLSAIMRDFKKFTSKKIIAYINTEERESRKDWQLIVFKYHAKYRKSHKSYQIWQDSNHPKKMLYPRIIRRKINYIHKNPVVAGIVRNPEDYIYSSAGAYIQNDQSILKVDIMDFGIEDGYITL